MAGCNHRWSWTLYGTTKGANKAKKRICKRSNCGAIRIVRVRRNGKWENM